MRLPAHDLPRERKDFRRFIEKALVSLQNAGIFEIVLGGTAALRQSFDSEGLHFFCPDLVIPLLRHFQTSPPAPHRPPWDRNPSDRRKSGKRRCNAWADEGKTSPVPLDSENLPHLTAAQGFLELGMPNEASEALAKITAESAHAPEVLEVQAEIYRNLEKWDLMQAVAARLAEYDPINAEWAVLLGFVTRRAVSLEAARTLLRAASKWMPESGQIHFDIACIECLQGKNGDAKRRLKAAFNIDSNFRKMALREPELKPLWESI